MMIVPFNMPSEEQIKEEIRSSVVSVACKYGWDVAYRIINSMEEPYGDGPGLKWKAFATLASIGSMMIQVSLLPLFHEGRIIYPYKPDTEGGDGDSNSEGTLVSDPLMVSRLKELAKRN